MISSRDLTWKRNSLFLGRETVGQVIPDSQHADMWRGKVGERVSDMANLSRAKDAVMRACIYDLRARQTRAEAPPMRRIGEQAA